MPASERDLALLTKIAPSAERSGPKGDLVRSVLQNLASSVGPGQRLPSERTIASYLGIARMTVQREIDRLVNEGLLYRRPKSGTYPAPTSKLISVDLLTSFSTTVTRGGDRPGAVVLIARTELPTHTVAASLQISPHDPIFLLSRIRTMNDVPVAIEHTRLPLHLFPGIDAVDWSDVSLFDLLATRWGIEPKSSSVEVRGLMPTPDEAAMLHIETDVPCLAVSGHTHGPDGHIIEITDSLFRADRYKLIAQAQRTT